MIVQSCVGYLLSQCGNLFVSLCVRYHKELGIGNGDRAACQGHLEVCKYLVEELGCHLNITATGGSC